MKKELSQIWKEMQTLKEEQIRHSRFLPKGDPYIIEVKPELPKNPILRVFKGIIYIIVGLIMAWVLRH